MSKKKSLTLSHQLSSAFWRLSAEPVRWSLWSGTAEDVLRTDVSTDVSVGRDDTILIVFRPCTTK